MTTFNKDLVVKAFQKKFGLEQMTKEQYFEFETLIFISKDRKTSIFFASPNLRNGLPEYQYMIVKRRNSDWSTKSELTIFDNRIEYECQNNSWPYMRLKIEFEPEVHLFNYSWKGVEERFKFLSEFKEGVHYNGFWILWRVCDNLGIPFSYVRDCKVPDLDISERRLSEYAEWYDNYRLGFSYGKVSYCTKEFELAFEGTYGFLNETYVDTVDKKEKCILIYKGDEEDVMKFSPADTIKNAKPTLMEFANFVERFSGMHFTRNDSVKVLKERVKGVQ